MADLIAWKNFRKIIGIINQLNNSVKQIAEGIDELKAMKEEVLDDPGLRAELKKITDIYPHASIQDLADDYSKFKTLKVWLEQNDYIPESNDNLYPL